MPTPTLIDVIRHGEPVGGLRFRGNGVDDPLSIRGWAQLRQTLGETDAQPAPWDQLVSSPLARCREFAQWLAGRQGLPLAVDPAWVEIGMGAWEGRAHDEVRTTDARIYEDFYRDPIRCRPPGAEPLDLFAARIRGAYARLVAAYPGRHLLVLCHAGVIRALVGDILRADPACWYRVRVDYAGLTRVRQGPRGPVLEAVNTTRLPPPASHFHGG